MQWPKEKGYSMIYNTPHRPLKIEQHDPSPTHKTGMNSVALEE
jgi:hypothetical protein